jgi:periplasmic glucans biosynthesis protein
MHSPWLHLLRRNNLRCLSDFLGSMKAHFQQQFARPFVKPFVKPFARFSAQFFALFCAVAVLSLLTAAPVRAQANAFGLDDVAQQARALAAKPYIKPPVADARRAALTYDQYRRIQFRADKALWRGQNLPFEMHFFPLGWGMNRAVTLHQIIDGKAQPLPIPAEAFNNDGVLPPEPAGKPVGVAGWRLTYPLNEPGKRDEVISVLGASYFRALGQGQHYGLSARGIAVDTTGGEVEEFPDFTTFWFERPAKDAKEFTFYALLDGPRVTGAYQFILKPGTNTVVDVKSRLFLRSVGNAKPIATLGIAPLTSMFLHGENQASAVGDFRPEVHDSDGLQVLTKEGEWIWRPLTNPKGTFVTSFTLSSPRGFGLMQRDRAFANYEDIEARYDVRPSAWIEPLSDWGDGRVELLQFNTPDETHDNIAAYWVTTQRPAPGTPLELAWRVHWQGKDAAMPPGAWALQTRTGYGFFKGPRPEQRYKYVIDFSNTALPTGVSAEDVQAVATLNPNARLIRVHAYPNPVRGGWRATVEFDRLDPKQAVELRIFLRQGANTLSETWSYALPPN